MVSKVDGALLPNFTLIIAPFALQVEETVTMVITGVVLNPGADDDEIILSMQDAVSRGLLDLQNGLYHNFTTGEDISFVEAMNNGYIKVRVT